MKILGCILILTAGTGIGFKASQRLMQQNESLKQMKKMLVLLKAEIRYHHSYLGQAFLAIAARIDPDFAVFLRAVAEKMEEKGGTTLEKIWEQEVYDKLSDTGLEEKHLKKLAGLGSTLGFLDQETQLSTIDLLLEQLEEDIKENKRRLREDGKLYQYLGVMGGILVVLVIL